MNNNKKTIILIPARIGSTRLPNKPLLKINGKEMILHVWENAISSIADKVIVATDSKNIHDLVEDCNYLFNYGIRSVAIMSNDTNNYPEDSFENMIKFADNNKFGNIEYLIDETQEIAKKYNAVCTPDFFGYNKNSELQYRGRIRELKDLKPIKNGDSDLRNAMMMISESGKGPKKQIPSMGCSIKWFN